MKLGAYGSRAEPERSHLYTRWISGSSFVVAARTLILDRLLPE
jgi:hypothetical protein